ncbi:hypothetical protein [Bradyrhizobium liaoningense]|uniref:hypothetical protein n=1 Tax=Bradyrhizobium liaoningense TaxID=43992 RepID=UPI00235D8A12|nr:hypothetical protein [Bradyrhizobium liaoningense]GLR97657.1 hypothetical protein GCM10007858_52990 [Bradyrhizobium liaoningense]
MSIPLRLYVTPFANRGVLEPAQWDCDTAKKALDVVNTIWSKAKIAFVISDCILDKPLDMAPSRRTSSNGKACGSVRWARLKMAERDSDQERSFNRRERCVPNL